MPAVQIKIKIVGGGDNQGLRCGGQHRRSKLLLSVVAQNNMTEQRARRVGEFELIGQFHEPCVACRNVVKHCTRKSRLGPRVQSIGVNLADVVQNGACGDNVHVRFINSAPVALCNGSRGPCDAQSVFQQTVHVRVMVGHGRRQHFEKLPCCAVRREHKAEKVARRAAAVFYNVPELGFKLVCNPTPVAIPFNDDNNNGKFIAPMGYGDSYVGGSINVQKLDKDGYTVAGSKFYWYDDEDGTAWFDQSDEEVEGEVLNPGEAVWVQANAASEKLNFPSAL